MSQSEDDQLPIKARIAAPSSLEMSSGLPRLVTHAGNAASFAYEEFCFGKVRNPHTRRAYQSAVDRFLDWCGSHNLELHQIAPKHVGQYLDRMAVGPTTKKLHLSARLCVMTERSNQIAHATGPQAGQMARVRQRLDLLIPVN